MIDLDDGYYKPKPDLEEGWDKIWTHGYVDGFPEVRDEYRGKVYLSNLVRFMAKFHGFVRDSSYIGEKMPSHLLEQLSRKGLGHRRFDGVIRGFLCVEIWQPAASEDDPDIEDDEDTDSEKIPIIVEVDGVIEEVPSDRFYCEEPEDYGAFAEHDKAFLFDALRTWIEKRVELHSSACEVRVSGGGIPIQFLRYVCVDPPGLDNLWRDYVHSARVQEDANSDFFNDDFGDEEAPPYLESEGPLYDNDDDRVPFIE